ncbi:MAG: flagellar motor switch protein FliN [Silvanigrellales bacterium]|nr:flagellar motor switch protein FliN [Silvanigrellales bacterium]
MAGDQDMNLDDYGLEGLDGGGDSDAGGASAIAKAGGDDGVKSLDLSRMKMVLDVPLKVTVELGRTKLLVNDLLQLGQGSVIELDKMAGEPMEIYVNDKLVALGEVVVVNEKFGVRLTDVMSGVGIDDVGPKDAL